MNPYMYLFVREDLTAAQQIVQTAHAVDELNKEYPHSPGNYMVLCSVNDEYDLFDVSTRLKENGIKFHMFYETDVESYTAIATEPLIGYKRKPMKRYSLKK